MTGNLFHVVELKELVSTVAIHVNQYVAVLICSQRLRIVTCRQRRRSKMRGAGPGKKGERVRKRDKKERNSEALMGEGGTVNIKINRSLCSTVIIPQTSPNCLMRTLYLRRRCSR